MGCKYCHEAVGYVKPNGHHIVSGKDVGMCSAIAAILNTFPINLKLECKIYKNYKCARKRNIIVASCFSGPYVYYFCWDGLK